MLKYKSRFAIRYTPEFRRQMVELVQAGRKPSGYPESLVVRLGHQGALSVVELKVLKLRLLQGREAKAKRGELIRVLAPRYVCDLAGNIVKDPNLRVQEAIALVFKKFRELGSIRQTYRWFHEDNIELPVNKAVAGRFQLAWKLSANALALPLLRITLSKIFLIFCLLLSGSYAGGGGRRAAGSVIVFFIGSVPFWLTDRRGSPSCGNLYTSAGAVLSYVSAPFPRSRCRVWDLATHRDGSDGPDPVPLPVGCWGSRTASGHGRNLSDEA